MTGVLTLAGSLTTPAAAMSEPAITSQTASVDLTAVSHATRSGADTARLDPVARKAVDQHVQEQAADNRLLPESDVSVALVDNPLSGGKIGLVWERGSAPARLDVFRAARADGSTVDEGLAAAFTETGASEPAAHGNGFGYSPGINPAGNMYLYSDGCRTIFFVPDYAANRDHKTTTCFQKWAEHGTDQWIYNRWAEFLQGNPSDTLLDHARTVDFTIRSRPWAGQESKVNRISTWTPLGGGKSCSEVLNFSLTLGSVGLSVPVHQCETRTSLANATAKSMGVDWDGSTSSQLFLDFGLGLHAANSTVVPVYADYVWAEVQHCEDSDCLVGAWHSQYLTWRESGW
ncbi:hypothetical protein AB0M80_34740 [Amycolatopsis sp. NPDC051045]|uniref:hypothetical protein n=1 Tax=Amycolatopsis sp. NPDC051045 TaxID=3156922 RepID=UPI003416109B